MLVTFSALILSETLALYKSFTYLLTVYSYYAVFDVSLPAGRPVRRRLSWIVSADGSSSVTQ